MNAFSRTFLFIFAAIIMTSAVALAAFDVSVHFNGGSDVVYIREDNGRGVYLTNRSLIQQLTRGLHLRQSSEHF